MAHLTIDAPQGHEHEYHDMQREIGATLIKHVLTPLADAIRAAALELATSAYGDDATVFDLEDAEYAVTYELCNLLQNTEVCTEGGRYPFLRIDQIRDFRYTLAFFNMTAQRLITTPITAVDDIPPAILDTTPTDDSEQAAA